MNFRITGPGFYRTRDGRRAKVREARQTSSSESYWLGEIANYGGVGWWPNGRDSNDEERPVDLIAPWVESVAATETTQTVPAPTPHHRTQQFRAETARMLMLDMYRTVHAPLSGVIAESVRAADALIAALDKPQPKTE
jgi:hypothetical protein